MAWSDFRHIAASLLPAFICALAMGCTLLAAIPIACAGLVEADYRTMKLGLTPGAFPNVDQREAQAAMHLWTRELARGMGIKAEPKTIIYKSTEDLLAAANKGELSVVSLPALDYLKVRKRARMSPILVSSRNCGQQGRFLIVTRRDSGIKSIRDLRGRSLLMATQKLQPAGQLWLSVLLLREGSRDQARYFSEVKETISPSKALLNVFFRKSDAVMLSRGALETSVALNPQLGSQLAILAESGSLLGAITCVPDNVSQNMKRSIENVAVHLHENSIGKQMFTLFQMDRVIPFNNSYLSGLEELLRERERLLAKRAKKR